MEKLKKDNPVKNLTKIISISSQRFLASFFDDSLITKRELDKIKAQIKKSIALNTLTVLQVAKDFHSPVETLYGKIKYNPNSDDIVILVQKNTQAIRFLPIDQIKKVSFIEHSHSKTS